MSDGKTLAGGCQCGAIRYHAIQKGRASICHCRMCQKAFGSAFGPLVTVDVLWTRGAPKYFQSSNKVKRGFCADCGTPLTYEYEGRGVELALGTFDDPNEVGPIVQLAFADRVGWFDKLNSLAKLSDEEQVGAEAIYAGIHSHQHPDHDTNEWPPKAG